MLKHKLRKTGSKFKNTSWNSKVQLQIHKFKFMSYEFNLVSYGFKSTSYEFKSTGSRII